jgi:hypothetical protein
MKAWELISVPSYGPETLKIVFQSFDDAWGSIAAIFGDNPLAIQAARAKLANIILSMPHDQQSDAAQIKNSALQLMALNYRTGTVRTANTTPSDDQPSTGETIRLVDAPPEGSTYDAANDNALPNRPLVVTPV